MQYTSVLCAGVFLFSGCTATQLRYQTLNQASTVQTLTERQILFNLALFEDNQYAVPSQVTVTTGSASTANSVSPTFMSPLGTATVLMSQAADSTTSGLSTAVATTAANSVAGAVTNMTTASTTTGNSPSSTAGTSAGTTTTTTKGTTSGTTTTNTSGSTNGLTTTSQSTRPNKTLSLALTDNWMESWTLEPVGDSDALRRLSALYRFILGQSEVSPDTIGDDGKPIRGSENLKKVTAQFMCDYPIAQPTGAPNSSSMGAITTTTKTDPTTNSVQTTTTNGGDSKEEESVTLIFRCMDGGSDDYKVRTAKVSRSLLRLPECVVCIDENIAKLDLGAKNTEVAVRAAEKARTEADEAAKDAAAAQVEAAEAVKEAERHSDKNSAVFAAARKYADARAKEAAAAVNLALIARESSAEATLQVDKDRVLIADAGAFGSDVVLSTDPNVNSNSPKPFLNPALIFGLVQIKQPPECETICYIGASGHYRFYAYKPHTPDPRQSFHDFELLVNTATASGPAVSGEKKALAVQTSPSEFILR